MLGRKPLRNRRVAALVADGFEKIELTAPVAALQAKGAQVEIVSLYSGSIRAMNMHEPAGTVSVDRTVADTDPADYDALLIPGGYINPDLLRQSALARDFVRAFDVARKPIATLCHGPWVLASAGLVRGRAMTSWPGVRDDMVNAGAIWLDQDMVRDGNWVTSRGPQDMAAFVRGMTELFAEASPIPYSEPRVSYSDPQREAPPKLVATVMTAMPRPSVRALLGLAVLGAAGYAVANKRRQASASLPAPSAASQPASPIALPAAAAAPV